MAQLTLFILSVLLILVIVAYGISKKSRFDIFDAYLLMIMLYFGVYSLADVLFDNVGDKDAIVVLQTYLLIFAATFFTWLFYILIPPRVRAVLSFNYLMEQWIKVDRNLVTILAIFVLLYIVYIYFKFGILSSYSETELEQLGIAVPSWVGPVKTLLLGVAFSVYIAVTVSIIKGREALLSRYGLLLLLIVGSTFLEGRRAVFELLLITYIMWSCVRGRSVYSIKSIPYVVGLGVILFLVSNLYQTYRVELLSTTARISGTESTDLVAAATNFDATIDNLKIRSAIWQFNYIITAEQVNNPSKIFFGALGWQAILNSVPRVFWKDKEVQDIDESISRLYGFEVTDQSTNNYATFQADFSILMIIMLPAAIALVLLIVSYFYFNASRNKTLFLIVSSLCLQYLIKIENSYGDIVILLRHIVLLMGIFTFFWMMRNIYATACSARRMPNTR